MTDGLAARQEIVTHMRASAARDPEYRTELAAALQDLADALADGGHLGKALPCIREAVEIRQDLAQDDAEHLTLLAGSLNQEANWLAAAGQNAEAEPVFQNEAACYLSMVDRTGVDRAHELAPLLNDLYAMNAESGRLRSAQGVATAAVHMARRAEREDGQAAFFLAGSLNLLAASLLGQGRPAEAMSHAQEAARVANRMYELKLPFDDGNVLITALELVVVAGRELRGHRTEVKAAKRQLRRMGKDVRPPEHPR
jgi:tetratricopeptide (TPR) repeat protein